MNEKRPSREALIRYYRAQSLPGEEKLVALYLSMDIDHDFVESCLLEAWEGLDGELPGDPDEQRRKAAWEKFRFKKTNLAQLPAKRRFPWYGYAAGIALFLIGTFALVHLNNTWTATVHMDHFTAAMGKRQEVRLTDSSTVVLFPGSTLDVPENFNDTDRNVVLNGRAFFQVASNTRKPFLVRAGSLTTRVLGTSFEVNAPGAADAPTITLRTGKVGISYSGKEIARLSPDQRITYDTHSQQYRIEQLDAAQSTAWITGELTYELVPLVSICRDLEKWYNVKITVNNRELAQKKISTGFKDLPVNEVLDMLAVTTGLSYTINGDQIIIH